MIARKSSSEIRDLFVSQFEAQLSTTVPLLPLAAVRVIARIVGAIFVLLYDYCGFIFLQMFIETAVDKDIKIGSRTINPLQAWGRSVDIQKDIGQQSEHLISIPVLTQGGTLTTGTRFSNTATGTVYVLIGDVALNAASVSGLIRCTKIGSIGNLEAGQVVSFVNAPASCERDCTVASRETDGVDAEETEHLRTRIKIRWASRPQGGAYADYWDWAMEVSGVKNAYPYSGWDITGLPNSGSGTCVLFIEATSGTDGIPTTALREDVLEYIQANESGLANRRPINAYTDLSLVRPISRLAFDVNIGTVVSDDIDALKTEITAGLTDYFLGREPFITGLSIMPRKDIVSLYDVIGVVGRIASANNGIAINVSLFYLATEIVSYYQLQEGEKAKIGELTWS